jgi:hypothetical protein
MMTNIIMDPYGHIDALTALAAAGVCAFAMELMPRITRAQTMDVLSSQANIAGCGPDHGRDGRALRHDRGRRGRPKSRRVSHPVTMKR